MSPEPADLLRERRARFDLEATRVAARSRALSWSRLAAASVVVAGLAGIVARAGDDPAPWAWTAAAAALAFATLVIAHDRVEREERRWRGLATLQKEALARGERRWDDAPVPHLEAPPENRALARDLQIFGRASLVHLLGPTPTPPGRETLRSWLVEPAPPAVIAARQEAVAALAPAIDLRDELALAGRDLERLDPNVGPFVAWAEGDPWLLPRRGLVAVSFALPALAWATAAASLVGIWPAVVPTAAFGLVFLVANLVVRRVEEEHERVAAREREMGAYARSLALLWSEAAAELPAGVRERLREGLTSDHEPAWRCLADLQRRLDLADARRSGTLRFLLDTLFLWDLHTLRRLELWRARHGRDVRRWLAALGELDALTALAALRFAEPGWAFPAVDPTADRLEAEAIAHPLIAPDRRVANDVVVGPAGTVLLVTGSNMSGKSTLLRALGANVVLAGAGGPVCATAWRMPPLHLATSILVEDSLESGLSFFMAEVLRIREVVAAAEEAEARGERLLYLLDEILRGTNSADRRVAVREVLARLAAGQALGAVTTHDLALAEEPVLARALVPVHFRETLHPEAAPGEPVMTFDHRLRPGIAPTTNALRLLAMFGLAGC